MRHSLVFRLTLVVVTVFLVATGVLAWIVHATTSAQFEHVMEEEQETTTVVARLSELEDHLEAQYRADGMAGIERAANRGAESQSRPFLVIGPQLNVIASTEAPYRYADVNRTPSGGLLISVDREIDGTRYKLEFSTGPASPLAGPDGTPFGGLVLLPSPVATPAGQAFAMQVWATALPWLLIVLVIAVIAPAWVLRRSLRPVDALTAAARQLGKGKVPKTVSKHGAGRELGELVEAFNTASTSIADTEALRRRFISDSAHELRTPVTNIKSQLEALDAGLVEPDETFRDTLRAETRLLETLVRDFQDLALSDAGRLRLNLQVLPLDQLVVNFLQGPANARGVHHEQGIDPGVEVIADEERLQQVLLNLFENAHRARPEGLVIRTSAKVANGLAALLFEDNGPGVAPEDQAHIFERFYRAEKSRGRATGGAGLGLAIARGLIEAMGGTIEYTESALGGAGFKVTLPRPGHMESERP